MSRKSLYLAAALLAAAGPASGQIVVEGVVDETVYADRAAFRVPAAAGYEYAVLLNGEPAPVDLSVEVTSPDYYELEVRRRLLPAGAEESLLVQFIVRASARGDSEWGLPPWVPYPAIPSAAAEFEGASLRIMIPAKYPMGVEIPVVAWVVNAAGKRAGVNGAVAAAEFPGSSFRLLRGVGSGFLPAAPAAGTISYTAAVPGIQTPKQIAIEEATSWTTASGTIAAPADWGEDARVRIPSGLTVAAGATLTIGAGSVVLLGPGADILVSGTVSVLGTTERPVVFAPEDRSLPWGGFQLRAAAARLEMAGAILTGAGADPDWFDNNPGSGSSHRSEEPLIYLQNGARAVLTDCSLIDNRGQAGHGESSFLTMTRCLVQRCISAGQYNRGAVDLTGCALVEFPNADAPFVDNDNDGLYLTGGAHILTDTLIGWALDDGVDAGSGSGGSVTVSGCWFESCYHEGMAWSEDRVPAVRDSVAINCGQGIECGFGAPNVLAERCLSTANLIGARFGDNYDWDYTGFLRVTDSLIIFNRRDVWGRAWDNWDEHLSQMDIHGNLLSAADPSYPQNTVWQPQTDALRLQPFLSSPAGTVGIGIALPSTALDIDRAPEGVPVRLSTFTTVEAAVDFAIESEDALLAGGTLRFAAGETVKRIPIEIPDLASRERLRVTLRNPVNGELTGLDEIWFLRSVAIIPQHSVWKYLDTGRDQGSAWRAGSFDDASWQEGPAELGFGDQDEATPINIGPSNSRYPTIYFRRRFEVPDPAAFGSLRLNLRRDDGAVVYLNGAEVFRSNMPPGTISFSTLAEDGQSGEDEERFFSRDLDPSFLIRGTNIAAVEVHQSSATSSDISFELELIGLPAISGTGGGGFTRGDANSDGALDISDPVRVLVVLFAGQASECEDALDADDSGIADVTDAIFLLEYLFLRGPLPGTPFPGCGADPSPDNLDCASHPACR